MTGFDVTVPAVAQAAATAATVGVELRGEVEALRVQAEAVLAGDWLGRAASSFECVWREWHAQASEVVAALTELAEALRATATAYCVGDEAARTQLQMAGT